MFSCTHQPFFTHFYIFIFEMSTFLYFHIFIFSYSKFSHFNVFNFFYFHVFIFSHFKFSYFYIFTHFLISLLQAPQHLPLHQLVQLWVTWQVYSPVPSPPCLVRCRGRWVLDSQDLLKASLEFLVLWVITIFRNKNNMI